MPQVLHKWACGRATHGYPQPAQPAGSDACVWARVSSLDGTDPEYDTKISKALGAGFYHKAALIVDGDIYKTYHGHHTAGISPDSCLVGMEWEWVICLTFSSSGVQYLRMVTAVDPEWLMDREFFRDENFPRNWHGEYRNPKVKESFDRARAALASRPVA
ncbi:hypothetical protein B0J15DRAFT_540741 [Fusarium solani]|uniref:DEAD-box helicase OB fold domain-containing protein n=1 Tax=Fusarium solani TaxID=169388 RepID=A0A9P9RF53_FUSSL|nr:uncharacterized protein B0J15DRAFT_540741 [Fusarium solani]KAH7275740.1 hypothetical protein B0J15DRAFT_540741 [Fusarium solani]